jgi:hypothetical protein
MAELKPKAPVAKSGSTLDEHEKVVHVAEIVQHGEKVIIPEGMSLDDTIDLLERVPMGRWQCSG